MHYATIQFIVYIFLFFSFKEEEVDHINMNFVSFSGNRISAQLVLDFLTWQLMRHKDPLLLHVSNTGSLLETQ